MEPNDAVKTLNVIKRAIGDLKFVARRQHQGEDLPDLYRAMIGNLRDFADNIEQKFPEVLP